MVKEPKAHIIRLNFILLSYYLYSYAILVRLKIEHRKQHLQYSSSLREGSELTSEAKVLLKKGALTNINGNVLFQWRVKVMTLQRHKTLKSEIRFSPLFCCIPLFRSFPLPSI